MVRHALLEILRPRGDRLEKFWSVICDDWDSEEAEFIAETFMSRHWIQSYVSYLGWYAGKLFDYGCSWDELLNPPVATSVTSRSDQTKKVYKYGFIFKLYDLVRLFHNLALKYYHIGQTIPTGMC